MNTGSNIMPSSHGLLTTLGFKLGKDAPSVYALEGAVATAGRGIQWLRDSLHMIKSAPEINLLAGSVESTEGVTFVPAFSGLLAPHWRPNARGALTGLSLYSTDAHIARAMALQATAATTGGDPRVRTQLDVSQGRSERAQSVGQGSSECRIDAHSRYGCSFQPGRDNEQIRMEVLDTRRKQATTLGIQRCFKHDRRSLEHCKS